MSTELRFSSKTVYRMEVFGKVSSLAFDLESNACLAVTVMNGAYILGGDDSTKMASSTPITSAFSVESYPYHCYGGEPLLSGCFINNQRIAFGSYTGTVSILSRRSQSLIGHYTVPRTTNTSFNDYSCNQLLSNDDPSELAIRTLHAVPHTPASLLLCVKSGATVVDMERCTILERLENFAPRAVAAVPLSQTNFLVANYDGKTLLYDTRYGPRPHTLLSIPDQITSLGVCRETAAVCVATVGGRVFTLRCTHSAHREQAFGTGKRRSPVRCVSICKNKIITGDLLGRLSIMDASDDRKPTRYWTADVTIPGQECALASVSEQRDCSGETVMPREDLQEQGEVTAVTLAEEMAWAAFSSANCATSQVVAVPA